MSSPPAPRVALGAWAAIRLVARREIVTRVRSKAYRITTLVMVLSVVAIAVVSHLVGGAGSSSTPVALTSATAPLGAAVQAAARAVGEDVSVRTVTSDAAGEQAVRDGTVDAVVTGSATSPRVVVDRELGGLGDAFALLARQLALDRQVRDLGGNPTQVEEAVAAASIPVRALQPPDPQRGQRVLLGLVVGILIYITLLGAGQTVAQGVVEEKTSRVVELLLATLRPWQLMAGKVLGIGLVSLAQLLAVTVAGAVTAKLLGVLTITLGATVGAVVWAIVWYLLGFTIYALLFAAAGALVSRQEDVGSVTAPMLLLIIAPYVVGVSVLPSDPENGFVAILSVIPFFAPMLMPWRVALDVVPGWELAFSVALALALVPALVWLTGRIYSNAVVRTGARVSLREALRA